MPYKDSAKQRAYQARWVRERRAAYFAEKRCVECGRAENLELDHRDPAEKVDHRIWSWGATRRETELAKCQALCRGCHRTKTTAGLRAEYRQFRRDARGRFCTRFPNVLAPELIE